MQRSSTYSCRLSSKFSSYSLLKHVQYLVNTGNCEKNNTFCQHDTSTFTLSFSPLLPTIETLHTSDWKKYQDFPLYTYSQSYLKGNIFIVSENWKAVCFLCSSKSFVFGGLVKIHDHSRTRGKYSRTDILISDRMFKSTSTVATVPDHQSNRTC